MKTVNTEHIDLEQTVRQYLAQFVHVGCGGQPVIEAHSKQLGCSLCGVKVPWTGNLGDALRSAMREGIYASLVVR